MAKRSVTNERKAALARWVMQQVTELAATNWWGKLEIKFEKGCPTHMRREESIVPPEDAASKASTK